MIDHVAYIGIGSNMGNRVQNCRDAVRAIGAFEGCRVQAMSPFYETEPVGIEDQPWFVNAVICIHTDRTPHDLFNRLKIIQKTMGRPENGPRFGPRVLDLDILFFDDLVLKTNQLEIPHPRAHERRFVLQPLCDLAPDFIHPVTGKSARSLLNELIGLNGLKGHKKVSMLS